MRELPGDHGRNSTRGTAMGIEAVVAEVDDLTTEADAAVAEVVAEVGVVGGNRDLRLWGARLFAELAPLFLLASMYDDTQNELDRTKGIELASNPIHKIAFHRGATALPFPFFSI